MLESPLDLLRAGELLAQGLAPLCVSTRLLGLLTTVVFVNGFPLPWRYRIAFTILVGGVFWGRPVPHPESLVIVLASELTLGLATGLGIAVLLAALRTAGEILDDRLHLTEATDFSPMSGTEPAGPCSRILGGLAIALVVTGTGLSGEMPVLDGLLSGFSKVPPGTASSLWTETAWIAGILSAGLELAFRVVLPVLAAVSIVDWARAIVLRVSAGVPVSLIAGAVRPMLGLIVLVGTFMGTAQPLLNALENVLQLDTRENRSGAVVLVR